MIALRDFYISVLLV